MIAEIIPAAYDAEGKKVLRPFDRRRGPHPTFPMGRYVSQPLTVVCTSIEDVRRFLAGCKGVSDKEQFGREDYWQPPESFEKTKKGDCDDFALWTWRQLLSMGYDARFIFGRCGRFGEGHAWVEFFKDGFCYLLEPQLCFLGRRMPRLSTLRYRPYLSVAWDGRKLSYYQHHGSSSGLPFADLVRLLPEYIFLWGRFWLVSPMRTPRAIWYLLKRFFKGFRWIGRTRRT
jgi:Bacterial transglutaminase-like cysteine proteinase BTLCP